MHNKQKVEALIEEGQQCLESEQYDKAIKVAKQIERESHSYAFELMALAYAAKDDLPKAVATLERGVKMAPSVWLLWQLLGNYYSDMSRWDDAQQAYLRALDCPSVDPSSVNYNIALSFLCQGKTADALHHVSLVDTPELHFKAAACLIDIYVENGDNTEAIRYAEQALSEIDIDEIADEQDAEDIARVYSAYANVVWKQGDNNRALELAWDAVSLWKHQEHALWLIREIENKRSNDARYYQLIIEGIWPEPFEDEEEPEGFFATYGVVADSPDEAFSLAARFEPEDVRESLHIEECNTDDEKILDPKGVYFISGYCFFPVEESD